MSSIDYLESYLKVRFDLAPRCGAKSKLCGNACVSNTKKCRSSRRGSDSSKSYLDKVVESKEDAIKNLPYERAIIINDSGQVLLDKPGNQVSVNFTNYELALMKNSVVTHNHPNLGWDKTDPRSKGFSFSRADVECAAMTEAKEMRAVSSGYRHSLKPPPSGWNQAYWKTKIEPTYSKYEVEVYNDLVGAIESGKLKPEQAEVDYHHEVIKRTSKELGMKYKREPI